MKKLLTMFVLLALTSCKETPCTTYMAEVGSECRVGYYFVFEQGIPLCKCIKE